jgi:hypothetical protein
MKEIHLTIIMATLAAALLQLVVQPPEAHAKPRIACSCAPTAILS